MTQQEPIRVNKALDKRPNVAFLPGEFALAWGAIAVGALLFHLLINAVFSFHPYWSVGLALALTLSHWVLFGDKPWKYGGKFHQPKNWVLGYPKFQPNREKLKPKVGKRSVGVKSSKRKVSALEDEFHLVCPVRIKRQGRTVGAYLLQKGKQFRLVWAFDCLGIRSTLATEEIEKIVEQVRDGFKDLFPGEEITLHAGTFSSDRERQAELKGLMKTAPSDELKFLVKALRARVQGLVKRGKHNPKFLRIYVSYTFRSTSALADGAIEEFLAAGQALWERYLGVRTRQERDRFEKLLGKAFDEGFIPTREFLATKLSWKVKPQKDWEIFEFDWKRFNRTPPPDKIPQLLILNEAGLRWEINADTHITTFLFMRSGAPVPDKQWVYLPGMKSYVGGVAYQEKPGGWANKKAQLFAGSDFLNRSEVADTEVFVQVTLANQALTLNSTQERTKQSNVSTNRAQDRRRIDVGADLNTRRNIEAEEELLEGEIALQVGWCALIYRSTPDALSLALKRFAQLFRKPAEVVREQEYFDLLWLETLPFVWRRLLESPFDRRKKYYSKHLPGLLPLVFDRTKATLGVEFISESGATPLYLDIFSKPQHTAILGTTGCGKSLLSAEFLTLAQANDFYTTVVDSTRGDGSGTFDAYTKFLGGAYFNCVTESNNLFESVDLRGVTDPEERQAKETMFRELLRSGLLMLTLDPDADNSTRRTYRTLINLTLSAFFKDSEIQRRYDAAHDGGFGSDAWWEMPTLRDFIQFLVPESFRFKLSPESKKALQTIRVELESCLESQLGRAIASPSTFRTDNRLVVYAIGGMDDEADMAILALSAYAAAMRRSFNCPKSLWFIDESSFLVGGFESFAKILGSICAKGRKSGISVLYSGQDITSIKNCKNSKQILNNTSNYLIGRIDGSAIDDFESELKIPRETVRRNTLDSFAPDEDEFATPWLLKSGSSLTSCKYYPSFEQLALLVNEPELASIRERFFEKYQSKYKATVEFSKHHISTKLDDDSKAQSLKAKT